MKTEFFKRIGSCSPLSRAVQATVFGAWVVLALTLSSCSEETPVTRTPVIVFDEQAFLTEIAEAESLVDLARARRDFEATGEQSPPVSQALAERWDYLRERIEPIGRFSEEADLIEVQYVLTGPLSWGLDYLFRVNQPFRDDYNIFIRAHVEVEDREYLSEHAHMVGGYETWGFAPYPPTSQWPAGEYILIHRPLAQAQPIPYRIVTGFYHSEEGRYGEVIDLGWMTPYRVTEDELVEVIDAAGDVFDLARIRSLHVAHSEWTGLVSAAFDSAWERLLKRAEPNKPISEQADLTAFEFKRTGEDTYLLTYLFDVREQMDYDYRIYIHGYVDDNHLHYLPEERREFKFANWSFAPDPPVSTWQPGDKVLVSTEITAQPIPYDLKTGFFLPGVGRHGFHLSLGWQADPER